MKFGAVDFGRKGWELTIYCFLTYFFGFAATGTMNMLAVQLNASHGWSLTTIYSFQSIGGILSVIAYFILGALHSKGKINIRIGILICGIGSAILIALWAICGTMALMLFVGIASVTYLFVQVWGRFFNDNHVANWFPTKKGAVMGWTTIGLPIGSSLGVKIYLWLFEATGDYVFTYIMFAVVFVLLMIWGFFSFRPFPEQLGYFPDNDKTLTKEKAAALLEEGQRMVENSPWTFKRIIRTPQIWALGFGVAFMEWYACMINQMMPNLLSFGFDEGFAANLMLYCTFFAAICSVLWGILDLRIGPRKVIILIYCVAIIGAICRFTGSTVGLVISMVCVGAILGGGPNMTVSIVSSYWGRYNFKKVFGYIIAIGTIFAAIGVVVHSAVAEAAGYGAAYLVQGAGCLVGLLLLLICIKDGFAQKCEAKFAEEDAKKTQ